MGYIAQWYAEHARTALQTQGDLLLELMVTEDPARREVLLERARAKQLEAELHLERAIQPPAAI